MCPPSAHNPEPRDRISDHREDGGGGYSTHHSNQLVSQSVSIHTHTQTPVSFLRVTTAAEGGRERVTERLQLSTSDFRAEKQTQIGFYIFLQKVVCIVDQLQY